MTPLQKYIFVLFKYAKSGKPLPKLGTLQEYCDLNDKDIPAQTLVEIDNILKQSTEAVDKFINDNTAQHGDFLSVSAPRLAWSKRKIGTRITANAFSAAAFFTGLAILGGPITAVSIACAFGTGAVVYLSHKLERNARARYAKYKYVSKFLEGNDHLKKKNLGENFLDDLNDHQKSWFYKENHNYKDFWNNIRFWIAKKKISRICEAAKVVLSEKAIIMAPQKNINEEEDYHILPILLSEKLYEERSETPLSTEAFRKSYDDLFRYVKSKKLNPKALSFFLYDYFREKLIVGQLRRDADEYLCFYNYFKNYIFPVFFETNNTLSYEDENGTLQTEELHGFSDENHQDLKEVVLEFLDSNEESHAGCHKFCYKKNRPLYGRIDRRINVGDLSVPEEYICLIDDALRKCYLGEFGAKFLSTSPKAYENHEDLLIILKELGKVFKANIEVCENYFSKNHANSKPPSLSHSSTGVRDLFSNATMNGIQSDITSVIVKKASRSPNLVADFSHFVIKNQVGTLIDLPFAILSSVTQMAIENKNLEIERTNLTAEMEKAIKNPNACDLYRVMRSLRTLLKDGNYFEIAIDEMIKLQKYHLRFNKLIKNIKQNKAQSGKIQSCEQAHEIYYNIFKFEKHMKDVAPKFYILSLFSGIIEQLLNEQENKHSLIDRNLNGSLEFIFSELINKDRN